MVLVMLMSIQVCKVNNFNRMYDIKYVNVLQCKIKKYKVEKLEINMVNVKK